MPAKHFLIIRNYVLSVSSQRKYNFYHQNTLLDAFRMNSRNIIVGNPSMVIPLLANQDLTPMLVHIHLQTLVDLKHPVMNFLHFLSSRALLLQNILSYKNRAFPLLVCCKFQFISFFTYSLIGLFVAIPQETINVSYTVQRSLYV